MDYRFWWSYLCYITLEIARVSALNSCDLEYLGCFTDTSSHDLTGSSNNMVPTLTNEICMQNCVDQGFTYAGSSHAKYCYCGNSYGSYGQAEESDCESKCPADDAQICGGYYVNSIYKLRQTGNISITIPPPKFVRAGEIDSVARPKRAAGSHRSGLECGVSCFSAGDCAAFSYIANTKKCFHYKTCARPVSVTIKNNKEFHFVRSNAENLALVGETSMSGTLTSNKGACLAIDGDPETSFKTSSGKPAGWRVDLGAERCVWEVNIIISNPSVITDSANPTDIVITVTSVASTSTDDMKTLCGQIDGEVTDDTLIVCDQPLSGRYVQVHNTGHSAEFHLAEVQVFGF